MYDGLTNVVDRDWQSQQTSLMVCQTCGIDSVAHQRLGWSNNSIDFRNNVLQSQLQEAQYTNQINAVRSKIFEEQQTELQTLRQELSNLRTAYTDQRTQLAITQQASNVERAAHQRTEKYFEQEQNSIRDFIAFLDTVGFPRASNENDNVSIGTIWLENRTPRQKGRKWIRLETIQHCQISCGGVLKFQLESIQAVLLHLTCTSCELVFASPTG